MIVSIDFETRSRVELGDYGLDNYAKDPSTEVICMAYVTDDGDSGLWTPVMDMPDFMTDPDTVFQGWNVAFEYNILKHVLDLPVKWSNMIDSMAIAAANNIPQSLEEAAIFVGAVEQKDPEGKRLIQKLSKPQKDGTFNTDLELIKSMHAYCIQDVKTEMAVVSKLRKLTAEEQRVWVLTQEINERGIPVDEAELQNAVNAVTTAKEAISDEIHALTGGISASQPASLVVWLKENHDIDMHDMTAESVSAMLSNKQLPEAARRVLELRSDGSSTSVAKFKKMLDVQHGGRIRNLFVYHGASTGRWASRGGLNIQNLPRPDISLKDEDIRSITDRVLVRGEGASITELSSVVRSVLRAPEGYAFIDADFSSIENRVAAWLPNQKDKLKMFEAGMDEYKVFASESMYLVPYEEVTKDMRQISKSAVLGCFGAETRVLTSAGYKPIVDITPKDWLWDGEEWVKSAGGRFMGQKWIIEIEGVKITPDHLILSEAGWERADTVDLKSALSLAAGKLSAMQNIDANTMAASGVNAVEKATCRLAISDQVKALNASPVHLQQQETLCSNGLGILSWKTQKQGNAGSIVDWQPSQDVTTQKTPSIKTMVQGAFTFMQLGAKTLLNSFALFKPCRAMMIQGLNSTALTITDRMFPGMSSWPQENNNHQTRAWHTALFGITTRGQQLNSGENSHLSTVQQERYYENLEKVSLRNKSSQNKLIAEVPTYDVINCGPRNRFTIMTNGGPIIVHNCMFGQGGKGLVAYAEGMGVKMALPQAEMAVKKYRESYHKVKACWYEMEAQAIAAIRTPGVAFSIDTKRVTFKVVNEVLWMRLPSGRLICWQKPEVSPQLTPWGAMKDGITVINQNTVTRKWGRNKLIGSSIFQSAVQAIARDLLALGLLRLDDAGFNVIGCFHDEILRLEPLQDADSKLQQMIDIMTTQPDWAKDLPLAAEGWVDTRFRK